MSAKSVPSIGLLLHPGEDHVVKIVGEHARAHGWTAWSVVDDAAAVIAGHAASTRLLVTVGGDGTFLLGARIAAPLGIPVLGVNRGRLGFLTDLEIGSLPEAVDQFIEGRCVLHRRTLLEATAGTISTTGLNDVVVKAKGVTVSRLRISVDGELLGEFDADGVVVATSTGSTAYAMSAGGPLVDPRVESLIIVPLASHAVMTRAVVLPAGVQVEIGVDRGHVVAAADGQQPVIDLAEGESLTIGPGPPLDVVHLPGSPTFQQRLRDKLRFGVPLKARDHPLHPPASDQTHTGEADGTV